MASINNINLNQQELLSRMRSMAQDAMANTNGNLINDLRPSIQEQSSSVSSNLNSTPSNMSFLDHLKEGLESVNELQKGADSMAMDLASGKSQNLHETMLAATQAELGFNLTVQIRNRILEAYQEVMRLPV